VVRTTGPAARLTLKADRASIEADGSDLSFVTVSVADNAGLTVPRAKNLIHFELSGPGEIVAVDNGDATSHESFQSKGRAAYNGLCLVVVRSKAGAPGSIKLRASSEGLKSADVTVRSRRAR
jgi:beta-galactosidase